jgi:hypothetical protein
MTMRTTVNGRTLRTRPDGSVQELRSVSEADRQTNTTVAIAFVGLVLAAGLMANLGSGLTEGYREAVTQCERRAEQDCGDLQRTVFVYKTFTFSFWVLESVLAVLCGWRISRAIAKTEWKTLSGQEIAALQTQKGIQFGSSEGR